MDYEDNFRFTDTGSTRITNDGTSKTVTVPSACAAFYCIAEGGPIRLEIDGVASVTSTFYIPEGCPRIYPLWSGQTLACYGASGTVGNFRFVG